MTFIDYFYATDWAMPYRMLTSGDFPLILQLLAINTVFLIFYLVRNATAKYKLRQSTIMTIQGALLFANLALVMQDRLLPFVYKYTVL